MKRLLLTLCMALACVFALAAERASADEAVALVKQAIAYVQAQGKQKALLEFMNPHGPFVKGELYLFVYDGKGTNLAHIDKALVGKNLLGMRDADGVFLIKNVISIGNSKEGKGWQQYRWPNAVTQQIEVKRSYTERYQDLYISAGVYK